MQKQKVQRRQGNVIIPKDDNGSSSEGESEGESIGEIEGETEGESDNDYFKMMNKELARAQGLNRGIPLDEVEKELTETLLKKGKSIAHIAEKINRSEKIIQAYSDLLKRQEEDLEENKKAEAQRKIDAQKKKELDAIKKRNENHVGSFMLDSTVLADYYGIGSYYKGEIKSKNYKTGKYQVFFAESGTKQNLPSPRLRPYREGHIDGDRLDNLAKILKKPDGEILSKKKKKETKNNSKPGNLAKENIKRVKEKPKKEEKEKKSVQFAKTTKPTKKSNILESKSKAKKKPMTNGKANISWAEQKKIKEKQKKYGLDALGKKRMHCKKCNCKRFVFEDREPKMCSSCWHTDTDHDFFMVFRPGALVQYCASQGWQNGTICMVNRNGTYTVQPESGGQNLTCIPDNVRSRRMLFKVGDKVEYSTVKGWLNGTIAKVNEDSTYDIISEYIGQRVKNWGSGNVKARSAGYKWKCPLCAYNNKSTSERCDICLYNKKKVTMPKEPSKKKVSKKNKFHVGDLIEYSTPKGWMDGTISEVNEDKSYDILGADGARINKWSARNIDVRSKGKKWPCDICRYNNKADATKCEVCMAQKPEDTTPSCPGKHELKVFITESPTWWCSVCEEVDLPVGTKMHSCRICDWDCCSSCLMSDAERKRIEEEKKRAEEEKKRAAYLKRKKEEEIAIKKEMEEEEKEVEMEVTKEDVNNFISKFKIENTDTIWKLSEKGVTEKDCIIIGYFLRKAKPSCPGRHYAIPFKTPSDTWFCSVCEEIELPEGTRMYGCRQCDWDCCRDCYLVNKVKELYLDGNNINDKGVSLIGKALKYNKTVKRLCLNKNRISDEGIKCISRALMKNSSLKILELNNNPFGDLGGRRISIALKINTTIEKLEMRRNHLNAPVKATLQHIQSKRSTLTIDL